MSGRRVGWVAALGLVLALAAAPAHAAYPGANGRIAFVSAGAIWTVNPDGSAPLQVTSPTSPSFDADPSWSPDGTRIAFSRGSSSARDIYVANIIHGTETLVTTSGYDPTWSPGGSEIAFIAIPSDGVYRVNTDGSNRGVEVYVNDADAFQPTDPAWSPSQPSIAFGWIETGVFCDPFDPGECEGFFNDRLGNRPIGQPCQDCWARLGGGSDPEWSPTGLELVHATAQNRTGWDTWSGTSGDIAAVSPDGTSSRTIVGGPETDSQPAWSPDGSLIVFRRGTGATGLWVVGADGTDPVQILDHGTEPDWQPVQRPYVRPAGATSVVVPLVTAFERCTAPNRTHGPSLAFPSCNPPQPASPNAVVSAGESRLRSVGSVRLGVLAGVPGPPDDSDVRMRFNLTNVMNSSDLSDYTGVVQPQIVVRMTDRDGFQRQTTQDFPVRFSVPCTATASTTDGALCALVTSVESLVPGAVAEGTRSVWGLDQVRVYDGGPAGDGDNASLFAVQGVFVP